jgi:hypothetical protein
MGLRPVLYVRRHSVSEVRGLGPPIGYPFFFGVDPVAEPVFHLPGSNRADWRSTLNQTPSRLTANRAF